MTEMQQMDRRTGDRIPSNQSLYFSDSEGWASLCIGSLVDRSPGGVCIRSEMPQSVGTRLDLELISNSDDGFTPRVLEKGEVRYVARHDTNGYVLGLSTVVSKKRKPVKMLVTIPERALPPITTRPKLVSVEKPTNQETSSIASKRRPSKKSVKYPRSLRIAFATVLLVVALFLFMIGTSKPQPEGTRLSAGTFNSRTSTLGPKTTSDLDRGAATSYGYMNDNPSVDTEAFLVRPTIPQKPKDPFLLASLIPDYSGINHDGSRRFAETRNPSHRDGASLSAVEGLARDLTRAQESMRSGNRTAALYLTRNAVANVGDLPAPWQEVLREFRGRLISHPGEVPALPELNDWVTLSAALTSMPLNAPIVVYVDKDAFVLHVVKNGETLWQFPVGLGANGATPEGIFTLGTKITKPDWYNRGDVVAAGSPDNPLGDRWMGLSDAGTPMTYGIHPTAQSDSISEALSRGCIRMRPADARRLYNMIPLGTPIVIRSGGMAPKL